MAKEQQQILEYLLLQYIDGRSSPAEEEKLFAILKSKHFDTAKLEELIEELMPGDTEFAHYKPEEWQAILKSCIDSSVERKKTGIVTSPFIFRWVAAAVVILLVGVGSFWLLNRSGKPTELVSKVVPVQDISSPVTSTAVLTLSNGKKVLLDKIPGGVVSTDGGSKLVKSADGRLVYEAAVSPNSMASLSWNTITNPTGSPVVNISLSDGTRVWLNTGSSITYPALFAGQQRQVEVIGEAYFEVERDKNKPFIVKGGGMQVQVLGTHFNINNYADEPLNVTTLFEGSVKVTRNEQAVILKPGQQASLAKSQSPEADKITVINDADLKSVIAWKNGLFDFNNAHILTITRQLARWYNVDVVYSGKVPERHYTGAIRKSVNLSEVIKMIELAGGVKVTIDNKRMIVQEK